MVLTKNVLRLWLLAFTANLFILKPLFAYKLPPADTKVELGHDTKMLRELSKGVGAIAEASKKALVFVSVSKTVKGLPGGIDPYDLFGFGRRQIPVPRQEGLGSGFFIDLDEGLVLTNNHVIDNADEINLKLANGETYKATVVGVDPNTDVAVVKINEKKFKRDGLSSLILGDSEGLNVGSFVVALGAPFGLEASVSFGAVSALGRGSLQITQLGDFIQTDAAINPGNSGGPLVDMEGKVIGINTAIFSKSGGYNGIGFAVPSNLVREVATNLINGVKLTRGYIGVHFQALTNDIKKLLKVPEDNNGVLVVQVEPNGPADNAGIKPKDVITEVDNKKLEKDRDLVNRVGLMKPGTKAKLTIIRNGKELKRTLTIGVYPGSNQTASNDKQEASKESLGLEFQLKEGGLFITSIDNESPARRQLQEGDVIISVDSFEVEGTKNLADAMKGFKDAIARARKNKQKSVLMRIKRNMQGGSGFAFVSVDI
ncbi:MAG: trypsin-like peptidase domain-containing protein [Oligoflexales bacterium]|nr:trypsin-like peptidase domain-containing protein [Oligoflexales bacterium]